LVILPTNDILIIYFRVIVKSLFNAGKAYEWFRPASCPACNGIRLWGHGFAGRYFHGFIEKVWVKRYRCPDCQSVHTMRPSSHWRRFHYSWRVIITSLLYKVRCNKWLGSISRQSQQYWFSGLIIQLSCYRNISLPSVEDLRGLVIKLIIPPSHSKQSECLRI